MAKWNIFIRNLKGFETIFPKCVNWLTKISQNIHNLLDENETFLTNIFKNKKCGSGSDTLISGWITDFFMKIPHSFPKLENFNPHVSTVSYKNLSSGRSFKMYSGLFQSRIIDGFLVPEYAYVINEMEAK